MGGLLHHMACGVSAGHASVGDVDRHLPWARGMVAASLIPLNRMEGDSPLQPNLASLTQGLSRRWPVLNTGSAPVTGHWQAFANTDVVSGR